MMGFGATRWANGQCYAPDIKELRWESTIEGPGDF